MAKPGGLLSFTHKTSVWPDWEEEQDRLEAAGLWQKVCMGKYKVTNSGIVSKSLRCKVNLSWQNFWD